MQEWPFHVECGQAAHQEAHSGLEPVAEEALDWPPEMDRVAGCLLYVLGLEYCESSIMDAIPTGGCLITAYHCFEILTAGMSSQMSWPHR